MKTITNIPKEAMPVVRVLRRDVKRPRALPLLIDDVLRWARKGKEICPMGLHKKSMSKQPMNYRQFADGCCSQESVTAFYGYWDELFARDARNAVNDIWPKSSKGRT